MGQKPQKSSWVQNSVKANRTRVWTQKSISHSLSLSLFTICLRFVLNVVSLGLEECKPHRTPFALSNLKLKIEVLKR